MIEKSSEKQFQQDQKIQKIYDQKSKLLQKILSFASQQKLLPKFLQEFDKKCDSINRKRHLQHQKSVRKIYSQRTKIPLKYNADQALTAQEKLRIKIQKIKNNQLQIEYFEKLKLKDGRYLPLFKGAPLQNVNYPTKKQFQIFCDFNEKKFNKSYSHIFQDQLQLKQAQILRKKRINTIPVLPQITHQSSYCIPNPKINKTKIDDFSNKDTQPIKKKKSKFRPITEITQKSVEWSTAPEKSQNQKYKPHLEKITIGKLIQDVSRSKIYEKMLKIGSYPSSVTQSSIYLTKQSLTKYLKGFYQKQFRIVEFLEVRPTLSLDQYENLYKKLNLMCVEHIVFMSFLFYDFNNDGYICDLDIKRLKSLVNQKKNKIIEEDLKILQTLKQKKQYQLKVLFQKIPSPLELTASEKKQDDCNYLELYKLPQITQSTFFVWLHKNKERDFNKQTSDSFQKQLETQKVLKNNQKRKKFSNPFDISVMKQKYDFAEEKPQLRKYIFNIKSNKTYISFNEFRKRYLYSSETKKTALASQSRAIEIVIPSQNISKNNSILANSRYKQSMSQVKIQSKAKNLKDRQKKTLAKPFLWYDLLDKIAGVRYEGLNYE